MKLYKIIVLFIHLSCNHAAHTINKPKAQQCSGHICISPEYMKAAPPFLNETNWMNVFFDGIRIQKVDDIDRTISLSLEIYVHWKDPNLEVQNATWNKNDFFSLEKSFLDLLWIPDIYIYDAKKVLKNHVSSDFESLIYRPWTQMLIYSVALNLEILCHQMVFETYPFDSHVCYFEMGSYTYPKEQINFKKPPSKELTTSFSSSNFLIELGKLPKSRNVSHWGYSKTGFEMRLCRNFAKYMYNCYIPTALMVITSWVNFSLSYLPKILIPISLLSNLLYFLFR